MSATSAITISYELNPPKNVDVSGLEPRKTYTIPVNKGTAGDQKSYYLGLQAAISEAKAVFGDDLTVWRDRVGKAEVMKEPEEKVEDEDV